MKKWIAWALALCLMLSLCACKEESKATGTNPGTAAPETTEMTEIPQTTQMPETDPEQTQSTSTPLLYKVTDEDGDTVWLMGSIHLGRESFYPLPAYVLDAYDSADSIGFEFDMIAYQSDMQLQMQTLQGLMYTDGTTIKDHIPAQVYEDAVALMTDCGIYMALMDYYQPVVWSSLIESGFMEKMGARTDLGVDMYLLEKAYADQKPIEELESGQFQMEMLGSFSEELQIFMLEDTVQSFADVELAQAQFTAMLDAWEQGDPDLVELASEDPGEMDEAQAALYAEYAQKMVVERNESMTDYAVAALEEGREVFICVGAAHIVGEGAMADLLAQRGYTVEIVTE